MPDREKVARAICEKHHGSGHPFPYRWNMFNDMYLSMADAAIVALRPEAQAGVTEAAKVLLEATPEGCSIGDAYRQACQTLWDNRFVLTEEV